MGYELHPETPAGGVLLKQLYPELNPEAMVEHLRQAGAPYGVNFNAIERLSNSRPALETSEFAREQGRFEELHTRLFQAYFLEKRDIGDMQTVLEVSGEVGLNVAALKECLEKGVYSPRLQKARERGKEHQVTGLPTFIINGKTKIVGAQPYEVFVKALKYLSGGVEQ